MNSRPSHRYTGNRPDLRDWMKRFPEGYLEIGCGSGGMLAMLKQQGCVKGRCVGVETDPDAAREAGQVFDVVYNESVEKVLTKLPMVGCLVLADVLEHMEDPWGVLGKLAAKLTPDGVVYASVPNVAYYEVSWPLFWKGEFSYADTGILDRTHLRFFGKAGICSLFVQAGLRIERIEGAMGKKTRLFNRITLGRFEHLLVGQYFIEAVRVK